MAPFAPRKRRFSRTLSRSETHYSHTPAGSPPFSNPLSTTHPPAEVDLVHEQVPDPQAGSLPDGGELRRLVVGVAQGGEGAVLTGELGQAVDASGCRKRMIDYSCKSWRALNSPGAAPLPSPPPLHSPCYFGQQYVQSVPDDDEVRVVGDEA